MNITCPSRHPGAADLRPRTVDPIEAAPARVARCVRDGAAGQAAMKTTLIIEIRAAEGGDDAKLLVHEQFAVYQKLAVREHL
ncbi:hypothetical protein [Nannocystis exedens]|uniref:hypothetical protein n=1 Tax=Nannocystis exedens TaxID=54 RepID=UPI001160E146|nr:hypothetical protein [Nannocystis exedens]